MSESESDGAIPFDRAQRKAKRRVAEDTDEAGDNSNSEEEKERLLFQKRPTESPQAIIDNFWKKQASEHQGKGN